MQKIGTYLIQKKLGQGGMGIVYKCLDPETQRLAAVKVLPQQLAGDPVFLQRFKREVMTLRRLDHPNIVRIFDQGRTEGAYYYAMEYVEGRGLESLLETKEKMDPLRAMHIIRGCTQALEHSHALGIIHRDIKPANVILADDGRVKLMDFGIAKVLDATRMTATQGVLGTVEYMSPEQSQGRHIDARSDLYSIGVLLYQCLTARLPITGSNPTEIIMKLRSHQVDPPNAWVPEVPKNLSDLVMRLLEKDPLKRVESAKELLRELGRVQQQIESGFTGREAAAADKRVLTTGVVPPVPLWQNPWLIAFVLLVVLATLYIRWGRRPSPDIPPLPPAGRVDGSREATAGWLLRGARRARLRKQYAYARDLCYLVIKHFSETPKAELAHEELKKIDEAKRRDAEEAKKRETASGDRPAAGIDIEDN